LHSSRPLRHGFCATSALAMLAVFALAVDPAGAATKSEKRKSHSTSQSAATKSTTSNAKGRRGSGKADGGSSGATIERYDPVGKD